MKELLIFLAGLSSGACIGLTIASYIIIFKPVGKQPRADGRLGRMLDEPIGGQIDKSV
jgi:hypothetical protein